MKDYIVRIGGTNVIKETDKAICLPSVNGNVICFSKSAMIKIDGSDVYVKKWFYDSLKPKV